MEESPAESDGDDDVANLLADAGIFTSYAEIMCRPLPPNGHVRAIPISPLLSPTHMSVAVSVLRVPSSCFVFRIPCNVMAACVAKGAKLPNLCEMIWRAVAEDFFSD